MNAESLGYRVEEGWLVTPRGRHSLADIRGVECHTDSGNWFLKFGVLTIGLAIATVLSATIVLGIFAAVYSFRFVTREDNHVIVHTASGAVTIATFTSFEPFWGNKEKAKAKIVADFVAENLVR
jgi:hypothetical protein